MRACEEAAEEAREVAEAGCLLLLYFSGHGALSPVGNVLMYTGGTDAHGNLRDYSLERPLYSLMEHGDDGGPVAHCFMAVADCCQVSTGDAAAERFEAEPRTYAAQVLCACPPGSVASAEWAGSFSPYVPRCRVVGTRALLTLLLLLL